MTQLDFLKIGPKGLKSFSTFLNTSNNSFVIVPSGTM